ncbi:choline dehydrogenase [Aestuariivirga litoralis]|uniref:choline dehydrogenase n=1 Tax=Aestuariivirga litoralis TaxID=2650924 RepID=UPI0018C65F3A|nr:choline dehydrogenase [Aestuariivirga litoralis]MBG1233566.1 choline dehydrogenase [Aestuariivirga litoralis]
MARQDGNTTDFIIIGSGSAGSVLASRLSADAKHTVLVLEYGGSDIGPLIQMPSALSYPMNMGLYNWGFETEVEPNLNNRKLVTPRGKVFGGSSSINGMVYVRGHARDFDTWSDMGATGWAYADVLPYFKRQENVAEGDPAWRGKDGPLYVKRGNRRNPLYKAFIEAGRQAGYPVTPDYNGQQQEGFADMEMTVHKGVRWSAANAYLWPAFKKGRIGLEGRAFARRILLEGKKAVGVEYEQGGEIKRAFARRDVIVSASTINSPALLERSGIGAPAVLKKAGVDVVHALPGVGANLQDHLEVYFQLRSLQPVTLNSKLGLISKGMIGLEWLLFGTGLGATNHFESCGFIRSAAGIEYPNIQYHFLPAAMRYDGTAAVDGHGFQVHVGPMRSKSRGHIHIKSPDPRQNPEIFFNYMSHPDDWKEFRACMRLTRELFQQEAMKPFAGDEIQPGSGVVSDAQLDAFIKEHAESAYHPCGTCRMGSVKDKMAVVDPQCRVIGMENLRVVDSSIMPQVTNGNLNAPTLMIGEKAADHILGKQPLAPSNLEPWINPKWKKSQR